MPVPTEEGLYWAKSKEEMKWFDLIIAVAGKAPMLYISYVLDRGIDGPRVVSAKPHDIFEWGPKIEEPKDG